MAKNDENLPTHVEQKKKIQGLTDALLNLLNSSQPKNKPDIKTSGLSHAVVIDGDKNITVRIFGDNKWLRFSPLAAQTFAEAVVASTTNHTNKGIQEIHITINDTAHNIVEYEEDCVKLVLKKEPIGEILANSLGKASHSGYGTDFEKELMQRFNKYIYDEVEAIYNQSGK